MDNEVHGNQSGQPYQDELLEMLYQMERVIITARKYPELMDTSPISGRKAVATKLSFELHALEKLPQYQRFNRAANLWPEIWGDA